MVMIYGGFWRWFQSVKLYSTNPEKYLRCAWPFWSASSTTTILFCDSIYVGVDYWRHIWSARFCDSKSWRRSMTAWNLWGACTSSCVDLDRHTQAYSFNDIQEFGATGQGSLVLHFGVHMHSDFGMMNCLKVLPMGSPATLFSGSFLYLPRIVVHEEEKQEVRVGKTTNIGSQNSPWRPFGKLVSLSVVFEAPWPIWKVIQLCSKLLDQFGKWSNILIFKNPY
jgi:hypothetical protein